MVADPTRAYRGGSNPSAHHRRTRHGQGKSTMITLDINGSEHQLGAADDMPLLWAIREIIGLTGTKFGCGQALCGACTVHVDGVPVRSCQTLVGDVAGA